MLYPANTAVSYAAIRLQKLCLSSFHKGLDFTQEHSW